MKIYSYKIGSHTVRCQFDDPAEAEAMWQVFVPNVLFHVFKIKSFNPTETELPEINGLGFQYKNETLTVFAKGFDALFVNKEGLNALAHKVPAGEA
mgnify:CR=1 FL=1